MVAKSDLQFAGEFLVEECQIVSTTGKVFDINPIVEEINAVSYTHLTLPTTR